ncbi:MAG: hypothetical protein OEN23_04075 [Paracoccaceae bacterium]|nr:hypothetical protein [Paracoccaceae bacterium]
MTNDITRRTALAAPAVLLPVAAGASGTSKSKSEPNTTDPAVIAYQNWTESFDRMVAAYRAHPEDDYHPIILATDTHEWDMRLVLASTTATTLAGLLCQLRLGFGIYSDRQSDDFAFGSPDSFELQGWKDDLDGRLYRSVFAGAKWIMEAQA